MQFDKPKVTIDLEEYQYLKDQEIKLKEHIDSDGFYNAARIILFAFATYHNNIERIRAYMANNGLSYSVAQSTKIPSYEDITISYKPINK